MVSVNFKSPTDVQNELRTRLRSRRLALTLTQEGLATRAGVPLPTLRKFERTGVIAVASLLKLALVLECLTDFDKIAAEDEQSLIGRSLDAVLAPKRQRGKGRVR